MALIKCSECKKNISDKAKTCPNCGCPVAREKVKEKVKEKLDIEKTTLKENSSQIKKGFIIGAIVLIVISLTIVVISSVSKNNFIKKYTGGNNNYLVGSWKTNSNFYKGYPVTIVFNKDYSCKYYKDGGSFTSNGKTYPSFAKTIDCYYKEDDKKIIVYELDYKNKKAKELHTFNYIDTTKPYLSELYGLSLYKDN